MAPLYVHLPRGSIRAASATVTLPTRKSNKGWYANWIMLVGQSPAVAHQMFVQIGLIRQPDQKSELHVFVAWQGASRHLHYRQLGTVPNRPHGFSIAQNGALFSLLADGRTFAVLDVPELLRASRAYVEVGPEVFAEYDALTGSVLHVALEDHDAWQSVRGSNLCHYENHGAILRYRDGAWIASGAFDRARPSAFHGSCAGI